MKEPLYGALLFGASFNLHQFAARLLLPWLWPLADFNRQTCRYSVAHQPGRDNFAGRQVGHGFQHGVPVVDGLIVYRNQDIAGLDACLFRRAVADDFGDQHTLGAAKLEGFGQFRSQFLHPRADPAARHGAALDDLLHGLFDDAGGNGETDAERAAIRRIDRAVDADQVAAHVHQRAAGIAWVDRGVGLDETLKGVQPQMIALECADDANGDSLPHAERVADGEHHIAHLRLLRVTEGDGGKLAGQFDLDDGEVGFRVRAE